MKLTVTRRWFTDKSTIGMLDIDGVFECFTLEPADTFAPGTFILRLLPSARFQRYTPHVLGVPGHTGIEFHPGNWPKDTKDCTLVGKERGTDAIWHSDEAFNDLIGKLDASQDMSVEYREERAISA